MSVFVAFDDSQECLNCDQFYDRFLGVFLSLEEAKNCPDCNEVREMVGTKLLGYCNFWNGKWGNWIVMK